MCYGVNETWGVRIHMQGFIYKGVVKKQARVQITRTSQARQRIFLGLAWVYDRQTISRGLDMRGNPNNTSNSPGEVQTQFETAGKGLIQDTQAEDEEPDTTQND